MKPSFLSLAFRSFLLGLPGVLVLPFVLKVPPGIPPAAVMANPFTLLVVASVIGAWSSQRTGLSSAILLGSPMRLRGLVLGMLSGILMGASIALFDHALAPWWAAEGVLSLRENRDAATLALGILYGGLTEEVIFRWGVLSVFALGFLSFLSRRTALIVAAFLSALIFSLAHLPAALLDAEIWSEGLIIRTLLWNGLIGAALAFALIRVGLEAAILTHVGLHIGFALAALPN